MGREQMERVYGLDPDQLALDERLTLLVLAESTADTLDRFPHRRADIAKKAGFGGKNPEKLLARRMSDLEAAGFISQKREKNHHGQWTGRVIVQLTVEDGTQTPRGRAAEKRGARRRQTDRDEQGRFHQPSPTANHQPSVVPLHQPSPTANHQPSVTAVNTR